MSKGDGCKKKYKRQKHKESSFKPLKAFKVIKTSDQNSDMIVDSEDQSDISNKEATNKIEIEATEAIAEFDVGDLKRLKGKFEISLS
ncbi:22834_t:CDS:2 [Cetraspora pellucida]|uniref:22834_t:CDS:1 n=1 Tax=Cetraspora pellucida TaxID=1433469 RepID=A0A9N9HL50_9GLOM|nr:22834_t:CDS:2 [Cetraspora pellucida]